MPRHLPATTRHAVFAPIGGIGRAELVARRLSEAIRLGFVADGEQLPSETELAAQLNVSTVTLREALAMLRQRELVETRRGRGGGTFVRAPAHGLSARLAAFSVDDLRDAGDHHAAVAAATARLAARRASSVDLDRLREHVERLAAATDAAERERADARFHVELAAAAHSTRLTRDEMTAQSELAGLVWLSGDEDDAAAHLADHRALLAAVAAGDADAAARMADAHVAAGMERILALRLRLDFGPPARSAAGPAEHAGERRRRARAVLTGVATTLEAVFASAEASRDALLSANAAAHEEGRALRRADLAPVRALALEHLSRHAGLVTGTGAVLAPGALEDAPRWLEWWCEVPDGSPRPLVVGLDPEDPDFYDYETAEWFATPRATGERSLVGPFVDYSGTNQHLVTPTLPVTDGERFLGVVGADVLVGSLAALAAPALAALGEDAALVNRHGRVLAANAPGHVSGALVAADDAEWLRATPAEWSVREDGAAVARDPRLPWALLLAPAS